MSGELPDIVKRAMVETVISLGQLSEQERRTLERYVKRGYLSKGLGGPFPNLKTVYAHPGFDFAADREREVSAHMAAYKIEQRLRANGYFDPTSENYGKPLDKRHDDARDGDQNEHGTV